MIFDFIKNLLIFSLIYKAFFNGPSDKKISPISSFSLLVGKSKNGDDVFIPEKGLYQNALITGAIGTGKTSSALYPFTKQLIKYNSKNQNGKLGFLVLDVKGNYYSKVLEFADACSRKDDVIVIQINGNYNYNPLNKPNLKASILANRLKSILLLFSPNNSESYWIDIAEQVLEAFIVFCRIYNFGYVSFYEIHKLVTDKEYYQSKIKFVRQRFLSAELSNEEIYSLYNAIEYIEKEYFSLDSRTFNILKSDITRITNPFVSDYAVKKTFCPTKEEENFFGFEDAINNGKIVVLNMNIAQYRNLSKIIAAYLKMDFQTDVISQLSTKCGVIRPMVFISDEYQEYVTNNDADFYSQSREAKCINLVATQSYTSLVNAVKDTNAVKVIIQNLVNKFWFRSDDIFTIEDIQKQIGKEEKEKTSITFSENTKENNYNIFAKNFVSSDANLSESINTYSQFDYAFDYKHFSQDLKLFECIAFLSDGEKILTPQKLKMIPYFKE